MPSVTEDKNDQEKPVGTDVAAPEADEPGDEQEPRGPASGKPAGEKGGGFFRIHKKGQGYWTRMGTLAAAALIGLLSAHFLYDNLPAWGVNKNVTVGIAAAFLVVYAVLVFWLTNKPDNVDFLIATDSEMKKVNWTSRRELIGSTKVVIIFMFLIASILFVIDIVFGYFFWLIGVLLNRPL